MFIHLREFRSHLFVRLEHYLILVLFPMLFFSCSTKVEKVPICFRDYDISLGDSINTIEKWMPTMVYESYDGCFEGAFYDTVQLGDGPVLMSFYTIFDEENKLEYVSIHYLWFEHENTLTTTEIVAELSQNEIPCINETWEILKEHIPSNLDKGQYEIFIGETQYEEYPWTNPQTYEFKTLPAFDFEYGIHYKHAYTYRGRNKD